MTEAAEFLEPSVADPRDGLEPLTFARVRREMHQLVMQKGWYGETSRRPQTPRNLALSLSIESAELLECFQWVEQGNSEAVADELADIVLYATQLASVMDISLEDAVRSKLEHNRGRRWDVGTGTK